MDNFSCQSKEYSKFRPTYPEEMYEWLTSRMNCTNLAIDFATGNGQNAVGLSDYFSHVIGVDISQKQLDSAYKRPNIKYINLAAEKYKEECREGSVDLVTIAQGLHFLDINKFIKKCSGLLKPGGIFFAFAYIYPQCKDNHYVNTFLDYYYYDVLADYWEDFRKIVNRKYVDIVLPDDFLKLDCSSMPENCKKIEKIWSKDDLINYMKTWTAFQSMLKIDPDVYAYHMSNIDIELNELFSRKASMKFEFELFFLCGKKISH
jgi:ubiquinone/menaquinone biosynthesis C-methylase UbiE